MRHFEAETFGRVWWDLLFELYFNGRKISPRDRLCYEFTGVTLHVRDAYANILVQSTRNPSYRFMVAEWLWIQFGRDDVATISLYNKHIAQFSDNGVDFNGAYGRPVKAQWDEVVKTLRNDPDTRQAVIFIFGSQRTRVSKDVPCTISVQFLRRNDRLETIVTMRSSDVWLGLPYDFFNFSMLANVLAGQLGILLGGLTMHLGSSHLYDDDRKKAEPVVNLISYGTIESPQLRGLPPPWLEEVLTTQRHDTWDDANPPMPDDEYERLWRVYARVLTAQTNADARCELT